MCWCLVWRTFLLDWMRRWQFVSSVADRCCALPLYLFIAPAILVCSSSYGLPLLCFSSLWFTESAFPVDFTEDFLSPFGHGFRHFPIHNLNTWDRYQPLFNQTLTETWCDAELDKVALSYSSKTFILLARTVMPCSFRVLCCAALLFWALEG